MGKVIDIKDFYKDTFEGRGLELNQLLYEWDGIFTEYEIVNLEELENKDCLAAETPICCMCDEEFLPNDKIILRKHLYDVMDSEAQYSYMPFHEHCIKDFLEEEMEGETW